MRECYFKVPGDAKNVQLYLIIQGVPMIITPGLPLPNPELFDEFARSEFREIVLNYSLKANATGAVLSDLAKITAEQIAPFLKMCTNADLRGEMELFVTAIQSATSETHFTQVPVHQNRAAVAKFSQQRALGKPLSGKVQSIAIIPDHPIFNLIKTGQFDEVLKLLEGDPALFEVRQSHYGANPLIYAVVLLGGQELDAGAKTKLRAFVVEYLQIPNINLTIVDVAGNTALHRSLTYGEFEISKCIIMRAKETKQWDALKRIKNSNRVGPIIGETVLHNLRADFSKLSAAQKQELLSLIAEPAETDIFTHIKSGDVGKINACLRANPKELNRHSEDPVEQGATPLLALLFQISRRELHPAKKRELMTLVLDLITRHGDVIDFTECNYRGNSALHYSIYFGPLEVAQSIVKCAIASNQIHELLATRNVVGGSGETPTLNLMAVSGHLCKEMLRIDNELLAQMLIIQKAIIENKLQNLKSLVFIDWIMSEPKLESLVAPIKPQLLAYQQYHKQMKQWEILYNTLLPHFGVLQQLEVAQLATTHQKHMQGYSAYNHLRGMPTVALNALIVRCKEYLAGNSDSAVKKRAVEDLKLNLERLIQPTTQLSDLQFVLSFVQAKLRDPAAKDKEFAGSIFHKVENLYRDANELLTRAHAQLPIPVKSKGEEKASGREAKTAPVTLSASGGAGVGFVASPSGVAPGSQPIKQKAPAEHKASSVASASLGQS